MLKLRSDQMTLGIKEETDFIRWFVNDYMPENLPHIHQVFTPEELNTLVRNGRNQAIQHGFHQPVNQTHFITFMWNIGANFYDTPAFKPILENNLLSESEKIKQFYQVSDEDWEKSIQQANESYWLKEAL